MNTASRRKQRHDSRTCVFETRWRGVGVALIFAFTLFSELAIDSAAAATEAEARLEWWRAARFGMFIHWGPVSLKGTEIGWSRGREVPVDTYDRLYQDFNPVKFDADAWVALAKAVGAKYVVLTSKHHDGFCLWDSKQTDYTIMSTPFHRDVTRELANACRRADIRFCLYHSIADWHHPDYLPRGAGDKRPEADAHFDRYVGYLKAQLKELVSGYGPLGILWFDGEWERAWTHEHAIDLNGYLRALQPDLVINNRIDKGRKDMEGTTAAGEFLGDYDTPEQRVGKFQNSRPWESCITICQQWAWKPNDTMKSLDECLRTLSSCAGGDGNLLLNVGPMASGEIEPRQADRLREIGRWLEINGEAIYETRGGPYKPGKWGASTHRGQKVYLHVFQWEHGAITLPNLPAKVIKAEVVSGGKVTIAQDATVLRVEVTPRSNLPSVVVIRLELDRDAGAFSPIEVDPAAVSNHR